MFIVGMTGVSHIALFRIVGRFISRVKGTQRRILSHLEPIIDERKRLIEEYGNSYPDKPVRFQSENQWLLSNTNPKPVE
jgi:hypothetical protein